MHTFLNGEFKCYLIEVLALFCSIVCMCRGQMCSAWILWENAQRLRRPPLRLKTPITNKVVASDSLHTWLPCVMDFCLASMNAKFGHVPHLPFFQFFPSKFHHVVAFGLTLVHTSHRKMSSFKSAGLWITPTVDKKISGKWISTVSTSNECS